MDQKECKSSVMPYIAIVAIVAVVAVVVLVLNGGSSTVSVNDVSDESALAGEARRTSTAPIISTPPKNSGTSPRKTFMFETSVHSNHNATITINGISHEFDAEYNPWTGQGTFFYGQGIGKVDYYGGGLYFNTNASGSTVNSSIIFSYNKGCSNTTYQAINPTLSFGSYAAVTIASSTYRNTTANGPIYLLGNPVFYRYNLQKGQRYNLPNGDEFEMGSIAKTAFSGDFNFILRCN